MTVPNRTGPLFDQVYEILWTRILSGEIGPGKRLSDLEWSTKLNVSRTPVREAMRKLQQDGVLMPLDRGGYEVRRMEPRDLHALYRCRAALEGLAAREAVQRASRRSLAKLAEIVEQAQKALDGQDFRRVFELNTQFHNEIIKSSSNVYLARMLRDLRRMILFARASLMIAADSLRFTEPYIEHLHRVQEDHREILALMLGGEEAGAASRMQRHIESTADDMAALASQYVQP